MEGGNEATNGAMSYGRVEEVEFPKKPISALPNSKQEPTLSGAVTHSPF